MRLSKLMELLKMFEINDPEVTLAIEGDEYRYESPIESVLLMGSSDTESHVVVLEGHDI